MDFVELVRSFNHQLYFIYLQTVRSLDFDMGGTNVFPNVAIKAQIFKWREQGIVFKNSLAKRMSRMFILPVLHGKYLDSVVSLTVFLIVSSYLLAIFQLKRARVVDEVFHHIDES